MGTSAPTPSAWPVVALEDGSGGLTMAGGLTGFAHGIHIRTSAPLDFCRDGVRCFFRSDAWRRQAAEGYFAE
jgi:hypothetical protein